MTTTRKRTTKPAEVDGMLTKYAERFGIWPAVVIAGGYYVFAEVLKPLGETYEQALTEISESNEELKRLVTEKGNADKEYNAAVVAHIEQLEKVISEGIERFAREQSGGTNGEN
jgi:hypothetical protein